MGKEGWDGQGRLGVGREAWVPCPCFKVISASQETQLLKKKKKQIVINRQNRPKEKRRNVLVHQLHLRLRGVSFQHQGTHISTLM